MMEELNRRQGNAFDWCWEITLPLVLDQNFFHHVDAAQPASNETLTNTASHHLNAVGPKK